VFFVLSTNRPVADLGYHFRSGIAVGGGQLEIAFASDLIVAAASSRALSERRRPALTCLPRAFGT
jgi:enoyl-CoA hydratase/carnithine racemase